MQAEHWTILQVCLGLVDDMAKTRRRTDRESVGSWLMLREAASGHWALYEARAAKARATKAHTFKAAAAAGLGKTWKARVVAALLQQRDQVTAVSERASSSRKCGLCLAELETERAS